MWVFRSSSLIDSSLHDFYWLTALFTKAMCGCHIILLQHFWIGGYIEITITRTNTNIEISHVKSPWVFSSHCTDLYLLINNQVLRWQEAQQVNKDRLNNKWGCKKSEICFSDKNLIAESFCPVFSCLSCCSLKWTGYIMEWSKENFWEQEVLSLKNVLFTSHGCSLKYVNACYQTNFL